MYYTTRVSRLSIRSYDYVKTKNKEYTTIVLTVCALVFEDLF